MLLVIFFVKKNLKCPPKIKRKKIVKSPHNLGGGQKPCLMSRVWGLWPHDPDDPKFSLEDPWWAQFYPQWPTSSPNDPPMSQIWGLWPLGEPNFILDDPLLMTLFDPICFCLQIHLFNFYTTNFLFIWYILIDSNHVADGFLLIYQPPWRVF